MKLSRPIRIFIAALGSNDVTTLRLLCLMQLQKIHFVTTTPDDDPLWDLLSDLVCLRPNSSVELELLDNALRTAVNFS